MAKDENIGQTVDPTVIEQKIVAFYDDELMAIRAGDGHVYVSVRHLCQALAIDTQGQTRRIRRQAVLERGFSQFSVMTDTRGEQQTYMLRVDLVPLFLSGVSTNAVSEEARPKLEQFQEEAAKVLWEAFQEGRLTAVSSVDDLLTTNSPAAQAYRMAEAIMKMARQQLFLEAQLTTHTQQLSDHEQRLEQIEEQLGDTKHHITPAQAMQISQAVKAIAYELGKQTKRNEYGGVYGELYRRYEINSYKSLPQSKFEAALSWLNEWYQSLTNESLPF
jgi:ferritin-like metal-binding protein YciE